MTLKYTYGYFELIEYDDNDPDHTTNDDLPELVSLDDKIYNDYEYTHEYKCNYMYTYSYFE
jgi:hypothetical protein